MNDDHDLDPLGTLVIIHTIDIDDVPFLHAILLLDETVPTFQIQNIAAHLVLIADALPEGPHIAMLLQSVVQPRPHHRTRSTSKPAGSEALVTKAPKVFRADHLKTFGTLKTCFGRLRNLSM